MVEACTNPCQHLAVGKVETSYPTPDGLYFCELTKKLCVAYKIEFRSGLGKTLLGADEDRMQRCPGYGLKLIDDDEEFLLGSSDPG